jgi:muramoyltetrapeptide carboxypeptidase LdcA involved in peptidoglycan recycling
LVINEGSASGTIIGGNLCTLNLLQGTEYFPDLKDSVLFIEDDYESLPHTFDRDLQSLIHVPGFEGVKGIVIGRFQKKSEMTNEKLIKIIKTKKELAKLPVLAGVDFGHTDPKITFPVGGAVNMQVKQGSCRLEILEH